MVVMAYVSSKTRSGLAAILISLQGLWPAQAGSPVHFSLERRIDGAAAPFVSAQARGLFRAEGLDLTMASRESRDTRSTTEGTLTRPVTNQGRLQERGEATMFQG